MHSLSKISQNLRTQNSGITTADIFNDPAIVRVKENMPAEQKEYYSKLGKEMYNIDFEKIGTETTTETTKEPKKVPATHPVEADEKEKQILESVAYLSTQLRSGLPPSMLEEYERETMRIALGDKWYLQFGYGEKDMPSLDQVEAVKRKQQRQAKKNRK